MLTPAEQKTDLICRMIATCVGLINGVGCVTFLIYTRNIFSKNDLNSDELAVRQLVSFFNNLKIFSLDPSVHFWNQFRYSARPGYWLHRHHFEEHYPLQNSGVHDLRPHNSDDSSRLRLPNFVGFLFVVPAFKYSKYDVLYAFGRDETKKRWNRTGSVKLKIKLKK